MAAARPTDRPLDDGQLQAVTKALWLEVENGFDDDDDDDDEYASPRFKCYGREGASFASTAPCSSAGARGSSPRSVGNFESSAR